MRYAGGEYPGAETIAHITRRYAHIQSDSNFEIWHSKNILKDRIFKFLRLFCTYYLKSVICVVIRNKLLCFSNEPFFD